MKKIIININRIGLIILFLIYSFTCLCQIKNYDEIHVSTFTDSSSIDIIVFKDSVLMLQLKRGVCKPRDGCNYGPKYYAHAAKLKNNNIYNLIKQETERILSDTFELQLMKITHTSTSTLKFLYKDSLIKTFHYYGIEDNSEDIVQIQDQLLKLLSQTTKWKKLNITNNLLDISDLKNIDSIVFIKLKPVVFDLYNGKKHTNYIKDYTFKMINSKAQIYTLVNIIQNQKIIDPSCQKNCGEFIPKYRLYFYRNGLISFKLETDLQLMPFSEYQILKIDKTFVEYFK